VVKAELSRILQQQANRKVEARGNFLTVDGHGRARFACAAFRLTSADDPGGLASYLCIGGWNNKS
jgi:hypothetical protein